MRHRAAILPAIDRAPPQESAAAENLRSDFENGFEAGARAKSGEVGAALTALLAARDQIDRRTNALEAQYRQQCAATLAEIIGAAAPSICEAAARNAIASIFSDAAGAAALPDLTLRASPDVFDAIKGEVPPVHADVFSIDPALAPGTIEARWLEGGLDCDVGRSLFAIVEFLNAQSAQPTEEPGDDATR
jgi:hypothetical protein